VSPKLLNLNLVPYLDRRAALHLRTQLRVGVDVTILQPVDPKP